MTNESWLILNHIFPGRADFVMQKTEHERMEEIATYLAQQIKNDEKRMPSNARSLRPDCSTINLAVTSDQPKDWLLHPTGITFKFDAKLKTVSKISFC